MSERKGSEGSSSSKVSKVEKTEKRRLGRGLSALLGEADLREEEAYELGERSSGVRVIEVSLDRIDPNPQQPRTYFSLSKLKELAQSIGQVGVIEPILVTQKGEGRYELLAGERRLRASKLIGRRSVPCLVREESSADALELMLIENLQREDLSPVEEAKSYEILLEAKGLTQTSLAKRLGRSRAHIANMIRLLYLPKEILESINRGDLTAGHGKLLAGVEGALVKRLAEETLQEGLSVKQLAIRLREAILQEEVSLRKREVGEGEGEALSSLSLSLPLVSGGGLVSSEKIEGGVEDLKKAHLRDIENLLREVLQTKVVVRQKQEDGRGTIRIEFYDDETLDAIIERLV